MTSNVKASADPILGLKKGAFSLCVHMAFPENFIFFRRGWGRDVSLLSAEHWIQTGGFSVVGTTM